MYFDVVVAGAAAMVRRWQRLFAEQRNNNSFLLDCGGDQDTGKRRIQSSSVSATANKDASDFNPNWMLYLSVNV